LFTSESESGVANIPLLTNCSAGKKKFREIIQRAAKHNIPYRKDFLPGLSREVVDITKERDRRRELDPHNPVITELNTKLSDLITHEAKISWQEEVSFCNPRVNPDKFWRLTRRLSGKCPLQPPNQPITFGDKVFSQPCALATHFCKKFTQVTTHNTNPRSRKVRKNLKKQHSLDHSFRPFTKELTKQAIVGSLNSTAVGPDDLTMLHLKYLCPKGLKYLTELFNISVANDDIPSIWKKANIIPIPKPWKSTKDSKSYQSISLLSPVVKVTDSLACAPTQHGYHGRP
jgi:hypothetical protein